ncbi:Cyclic pyranopterin monophosphate synthase [uncultured Pleomorphomonas sp.]|uniref:GTP 3',8-cyclase n=1 Tax=uncultured Pleomorphomonas sp. TaxID=442121 RepID=A0A212LFS1_9HYPH|nr:GTP 3',8-cyclase MoaA [uncultured Pleomorphomonas sp.]SCM76414.1 Cyclic pyranopterin monophosphate synthase [uncultured Pleomorphomonas sp.]
MSCALTDRFGRTIRYLRLSVTDRCDLRCVYCMAEDMQFVPRRDLLTLEELDRLASAFVARGVSKIRITGGEPLVRKGIMTLFRSLSRHLRNGAIKELTLTTNGTQLANHADALAAVGVRRVNVSLDTLDADRFRALTRRGVLGTVMDGLRAAREAGLRIKLNTVALKGITETEIFDLIEFAHGLGMDLTLIETMPLGDVGVDRTDQYLPLTELRSFIERRFTLTDTPERSGGPARYARVAETGGRLGFITPMTHNFCESCNRVRVSATGVLYTCLGQEERTDLRSALRGSEGDDLLNAAIERAIERKPKGHDFAIGPDQRPALGRHMSALGG